MNTGCKSIGHLSRETGVKVPTIRFYEQIGLMPTPQRSASDRRIYGEGATQRLGFIRHARGLGFSIEDIRSLLLLSDQPARSCSEATELARAQLKATEDRIARLQCLRNELARLANACPGGGAERCGVIEALSDR